MGNGIWEMAPKGYALLYSVNRKKVFPLTLNPRLSVLECRMGNMKQSKDAKAARKNSRDSRLHNRRLDKCEARKKRRLQDTPNHPSL